MKIEMRHDIAFGPALENAPEFDRAMNQIRQVILDGLRHGYFDATVTIDTRKTDRRELLIKAGKSYRFIIPISELPS